MLSILTLLVVQVYERKDVQSHQIYLLSSSLTLLHDIIAVSREIHGRFLEVSQRGLESEIPRFLNLEIIQKQGHDLTVHEDLVLYQLLHPVDRLLS